ncbi:hypothetical protein SDJN02_24266, partial [Cucurbita argyrosperma subsp. argyrosperma]
MALCMLPIIAASHEMSSTVVAHLDERIFITSGTDTTELSEEEKGEETLSGILNFAAGCFNLSHLDLKIDAFMFQT